MKNTGNQSSSKLCLLDTAIISEFLKTKIKIEKGLIDKNEPNFFKNILNKLILEEQYILCYSFHTLIELKKIEYLFQEFFNTAFLFPALIMKPFEMLWNEEIANYDSHNIIEPHLFLLEALQKETYYKEKYDYFSKDPIVSKYFQEEESGKSETMNVLYEYSKQYRPKKDKFTYKEIEEWVNIIILKIIVSKDTKLVKSKLDKKEFVDESEFLSIKSAALMTFYKFYLWHRNIKESDIFDIAIASIVPYVDAIVAEKEMCDIIKTMQRKHNFCQNVKLMTIIDFR